MQVYIEREDKQEELEFTGTAKELCEQLGINVQTILVLKNGELVTEEEPLSNEDKIKLVTVVSGG